MKLQERFIIKFFEHDIDNEFVLSSLEEFHSTGSDYQYAGGYYPETDPLLFSDIGEAKYWAEYIAEDEGFDKAQVISVAETETNQILYGEENASLVKEFLS